MSTTFRIIDTGVEDGRRQIAFDAALIELHKAGRSPDTLRFLRFPPTALVGRHQVLDDVVNVAHCKANGVGLVRRITGGGAIFLDEGQVGWELVLSRRRLALPTLADYSRAMCEAVAHGLSSRLGVAAAYSPPTDILVDGAKLCGTGGYFDGDTLVYQGTVLVDLDMARIASCLRFPKPSPDAPPPPRMTTLKALGGGTAPSVDAVHGAVIAGLTERLGLTLTPGSVTPEEQALATRFHDEEIGTDAFVFGVPEQPGKPA